MQYRRNRTAAGTYFFTLVTDKRRTFLCEPENISLFRSIFVEVKDKHPFTIDAIVILPDHIHCIWTLPKGDSDYSMRWRLIKSAFSRKCDPRYKGVISKSRQKKKEQAVWQRRFWEHTIENETDFKQHVEYIHYNPVKHRLTAAPVDWTFSSFHQYVKRGQYAPDWGAGQMEFANSIGRE